MIWSEASLDPEEEWAVLLTRRAELWGTACLWKGWEK